jgi:hypothetical protein
MDIIITQTNEECTTMGQSQGQSSGPSLKQNPFTTYRDPVTGRWSVVYPEAKEPEVGKGKEPTLTVLEGGMPGKRSPHHRGMAANLSADALP